MVQVAQVWGNSLPTVTINLDGRKVNALYNLQSKVKRTNKPPYDSLNLQNSDEPSRKIIHNDKWPIPITFYDQLLKFGSGPQSSGGHRLYQGSTYPTFEVSEEPFTLGEDTTSQWQFEVLEIQDQTFIQQFLVNRDPNLQYSCFISGKECALLRCLKLAQAPLSASQSDLNEGANSPAPEHYFVCQLLIMPCGFRDFWSLILNRQVHAKDQAGMHKVYKWMLDYNNYL